MRRHLAVLSMAATLSAGALLAHEGHRHVMGTIASADPTHLEVKAKDGTTTSVPLGPGTKYFKGKSEGTAVDAKTGLRVVIDLDAEGKALQVRLPEEPKAARPAKPASPSPKS